MRIEATTKAFREAFAQAAAAAPSKSPKEILKNVKATSDGKGRLKLFGTSLEYGLESLVEANASKGEVLLPAARVKDWLSRVTAETLRIESESGRLSFACGSAEMTCGGTDPDEFPKMEEFASQGTLTVKADALSDAIRRTQFATDEASARYAMGGILIDIKGETATAVATDSRRLSVVPIECSAIEGEPPSPIIPVGAANLIRSAIYSEPNGYVTVEIGKNRASFDTGSSVVVCRLVEGRFPRYADVIPRNPEHSVALVAEPLASALLQASIVTNEESRGVDFTFSDGTLELAAESQEIGKSNVSLPVPWSGKGLTVTLDARLTLDALRLMPGEALIEWKMSAPDTPVVLECFGWRYVLMPLTKES